MHRVFLPHYGGLVLVAGAATDAIGPVLRKPVVTRIGDSYYGGNNGSVVIQSTPFIASRILGVECY
jgi:hypothetical protein